MARELIAVLVGSIDMWAMNGLTEVSNGQAKGRHDVE